MNVDDLRYKIVRMPDNVQVATNHADSVFSDTFTTEELALYYYVVTPYNDGIEGEPASSNSVSVEMRYYPLIHRILLRKILWDYSLWSM